jgi:hypothetical protein
MFHFTYFHIILLLFINYQNITSQFINEKLCKKVRFEQSLIQKEKISFTLRVIFVLKNDAFRKFDHQ